MQPVWKKFLHSRKLWAFLIGLVTLVGASLEDGVMVTSEIQSMVALVIGYIGSVALEDGLTNFNPPKTEDATKNVNWNSFKESVNWNSLTEPEKDALLNLWFDQAGGK